MQSSGCSSRVSGFSASIHTEGLDHGGSGPRRISTDLTPVPGDPVPPLASVSSACTQTQQANTPMHIKQMIMRRRKRRKRERDAAQAVQRLPSVQGPLGLVLGSV